MTYPASKATIGNTFTIKVNNQDLVKAEDVNVLYTEVAAIEADMLGNSLETVGGASLTDSLNKPRLVSTNSTFTTGTTAFEGGLRARLINMDAGLYEAYTNRIAGNGNGAAILSSISDYGVTIRGAAYTAGLTNAKIDSTDKKKVVFTTSLASSASKFAIGQLVTISGLSGDNAAFNTVAPTAISAVGTVTVSGVVKATFTISYPLTVNSSTLVANTDITLTGANALVQHAVDLQRWTLANSGSTPTIVAKVTSDGTFAAKSIWGGNAAGTNDANS